MNGARIAYSMARIAALAVVIACRGRESMDGSTAIALIDSTYVPSWDATEDSGFVYRVEIDSPLGLDTVNNVVAPFPISVGDTLVVGLIQTSEDSSAPQRKVFRLRLPSHTMETQPLPHDVWAFFEDFVFSSDGRYAAYVAEDPLPGETGTFAVVRDLHTNAIVARGPGGGGCDCDIDANYARWIALDSFEIAVSHANTRAGWQRVAGRLSTRSVHIDTLRKEPVWE